MPSSNKRKEQRRLLSINTTVTAAPSAISTAAIVPTVITVTYENQKATFEFAQGARYLDVKKKAKIEFRIPDAVFVKLYGKYGGCISAETISGSEVLQLVTVQGPSLGIQPGSQPPPVRPRWTRALAQSPQSHSLSLSIPPTAKLLAFLDTNILVYLSVLDNDNHCVRCASSKATAERLRPQLESMLRGRTRGAVFLTMTETVYKEVVRHFGDAEASRLVAHFDVVKVESGIPWQSKLPMVKHIAEVAELPSMDSNTINDLEIFMEAGFVGSLQRSPVDAGLISNNLVLIARLREHKPEVVQLMRDYCLRDWINVSPIGEVDCDAL